LFALKPLNQTSQLNIVKWLTTIMVMLIIVLVVAVIALSIGAVNLNPVELVRILFDPEEGDQLSYQLVTKVRLPRVILGFAVGGALSLSGMILQGIYKNPLVEPYTLGISGGASLGVATIIVLGLHISIGSFLLPLSGFFGALLIILLVYFISNRQGRINIHNMLLTGVMISFIASASMMFLMSVTSADNLHGIIFWIMGSLDESNQQLIIWTLVISLIILVSSYFFVQPLNALRLGEEKAKHLGIETHSDWVKKKQNIWESTLPSRSDCCLSWLRYWQVSPLQLLE
jgi:iron complex transport system permease protein